MNMLSDIQKRILTQEYPNISLDSDLDVERYFDLRSSGRQAEALKLYNTKIAQKYPDPEKRAQLIRLYRSHDSRFQELLAESLLALADRLIERTKKIILILTRDIDSLRQDDAYSVIKLAESLLSIISPDRYEAIAFTEKYVRYAKVLDFRSVQMERTAELIRLYVTDNLVVLHEFRKENERKKTVKHKQTQIEKKSRPTIDLSTIVFDPADIARICLPPQITRTEDIVIAYCLKYWNLVFNPTFEKTIFLYSRKNKTCHHEIFQAIKKGREHNWKDEEILNSVLSNVVTGYYYSINGDLYLQRTWAAYKDRVAAPIPAAEAVRPVKTATYTHRRKQTIKRNKRKQETRIAPVSKKTKTHTTAKILTSKTAAKPSRPFTRTQGTRTIELPKQPERVLSAPNSIADIIRKKTGKTYTVYKELFFRGIRPSIRTVLSGSTTKKGSFFNKKQNEAEEIIYTFLFEHYNDPYQNWKDSPDRKQVEELGYYLPEIELVIEGWIKENR
ncbi:MAG TPA: hypothetical protein PKH40_03785 [Treponemataceae bacterium]|nr:hypothetical protein [Treponemataceae bacterium]